MVLLVLPDGNLLTKNLLREDDVPCTFSVLDPDRLELIGQLVLPVPSMGRFCADRGDGNATHQSLPEPSAVKHRTLGS